MVTQSARNALLLLLAACASALGIAAWQQGWWGVPEAEAPLILLRRATLKPHARGVGSAVAQTALSGDDTWWAASCSGAQQLLFALAPPITAARRAEFVAQLARSGAVISGFVPQHTFLVLGNATTLKQLPAEPRGLVRHVEALQPAWRVAPELDDALAGSSSGRIAVALNTVSAPGLRIDVIRASAAAVLGARGVVTSAWSAAEDRAMAVQSDAALVHGRLGLELDAAAASELVARLAAQPWAHWLEPAPDVRMRNYNANLLLQHSGSAVGAHRVWDAGIRGDGQLVGIGDSGIDLSSCYFAHVEPNGTALPAGPDHRKVVAYNSAGGDTLDLNGHGTHAAGSLAGACSAGSPQDASRWNGMAPGARIAFTDIGAGSAGRLFLPASLSQFYGFAYSRGARVHSDSWGGDVTTYDVLSRESDEMCWAHRDFLPVFAAGNFGGSVSHDANPATSKNGLAVGASLGDDVAPYSSAGPTHDGRLKPDIMAPGETRSAAASATRKTPAIGCETATLAGTSMSAPLVAGAALLVRQYFIDGYHPSGRRVARDSLVPSGALLKAVLVNGAVTLRGAPAPNVHQGFGRVDLGPRSLPLHGDSDAVGTRLFVSDASAVASGETHRYCLLLSLPRRAVAVSAAGAGAAVDSSVAELRVTIAWHDPPALLSAAGPKLVNDLDLRVRLLRPDAAGAASVAAAAPDATPPNRVDNVERRVVPSPGRAYLLEVEGHAVPWPADDVGGQPYALVVTGPGVRAARLAADMPSCDDAFAELMEGEPPLLLPQAPPRAGRRRFSL
jgi:hypothetical protein